MLIEAKIIKKTKWFLTLIVLLLIVINYIAIMQIIDNLFIVQLNTYLVTKGWHIDVREIFAWFRNLLPGIPILSFLYKIGNENFRTKFDNFYETINILHLFILFLFLPFLLYFQNKGLRFLYYIKDSKNPMIELWEAMTIPKGSK
jgi:hypothetical protein